MLKLSSLPSPVPCGAGQRSIFHLPGQALCSSSVLPISLHRRHFLLTLTVSTLSLPLRPHPALEGAAALASAPAFSVSVLPLLYFWEAARLLGHGIFLVKYCTGVACQNELARIQGYRVAHSLSRLLRLQDNNAAHVNR